MKKILVLIMISLFLLSCTSENEGVSENVSFELLPVNEVTMPGNFNANKENTIKVKFARPTTCHGFNKFYYSENESTKTFALESIVFHNNNCAAAPEANNSSSQVLKFNPGGPGEYELRFWNGKGSNGEDLFLSYNIIVE